MDLLRISELDKTTGKIFDPNTGSPAPSHEFTMHATSPLPVHTRILAWQPSNYPDGATEPSFCENDQTINGVEGNYIDAYSDAYMEGPGLFLKEELPCRVQLRRRAWTVQRQGRPRVPRLRSQHRSLRGVDAPRRRRRPAGSRAPTLLAGGKWRHVHGIRLPARLRERGGRRPMLRRREHPTGPGRNGWPSIWTKVSVSKTFAVGDPEVGSTLAIGFRNTGDAGSTAAFDLVSVTSHVVAESHSPPPSPPLPSPPPPSPVTTTASPLPEASPPPAGDDGGGSDIGAIAGGVGGGVAAVALLSVAVWNYARRGTKVVASAGPSAA